MGSEKFHVPADSPNTPELTVDRQCVSIRIDGCPMTVDELRAASGIVHAFADMLGACFTPDGPNHTYIKELSGRLMAASQFNFTVNDPIRGNSNMN